MAALEKIRKRAVILTIVIGAGLLAFILEEGVRASSSFFNDTTAAKVDNIKIDVQDFNKRYEAISQQNQNSKQDAAVMQQQVLGQMEAEAILNRECEDNAIEASAEELALLIDNNQQAQAWAQQYVQATGANNVQRPSDLERLMGSDQRLAPIAAQWNEMKENIRLQICSMKLMAVVSGCIQPNDLDLAEMNEDAAETYNVDIAKKDYASLDDAKFKPTDAEIKAVYDEYKNLSKLNEEQRAISFIAVELNPSTADVNKGLATVAKAKATLEGANGSNEIRNINEFSGYQEGKFTAADAKKFGEQLRDSTVNGFITGSAAGAVKLIADSASHNYTLLKMVKSEMLTDTLKIAQVSVQGKKAEQDKVLAALNNGQDVSKMKGVQVAPEQPVAVQKTGMPDSMITKLESATDKYIVLQSAPEEGAVFVKCTAKTTAQYYTVGMANYQIAPSSATTNAAQDKLAAFLAKNNTAELFTKNAAKAGYNAQEAMVSSSTAQLGGNPQWGMPGITNSRKAIRWALTEAKAGQVSNIFQDNNEVLLAVAVNETFDGDYMPLTNAQVKEYCTGIATARKKGESLKQQFDGKCKTVAEYATKFGSQAANAAVSFASNQAENINPADAGLIGAIAGSKAGATKFYVGNTAVYAYCVKKVEKSPMKLKKEETASKWSQMWGFDQQGQRFQGVLMGSAVIKNNIVKFM